EIGSIYKSTREFLKQRTDGLKAFKDVFNDLVTKVKEKSPKGEFERLNKQEKRKERDKGMELQKAPKKGAFLMVLNLFFLFLIHIETTSFYFYSLHCV